MWASCRPDGVPGVSDTGYRRLVGQAAGDRRGASGGVAEGKNQCGGAGSEGAGGGESNIVSSGYGRGSTANFSRCCVDGKTSGQAGGVERSDPVVGEDEVTECVVAGGAGRERTDDAIPASIVAKR